MTHRRSLPTTQRLVGFVLLLAALSQAAFYGAISRSSVGSTPPQPSATLHLQISPKTVESHRARIMQKLHLHDVPSLVRYAIRIGLIVP